VADRILGADKANRFTHRPADDIEPELEKAKKEFGEYLEQSEDVLTGAMFPEPAIKFFKYRQAQKYGIDSSLVDKKDQVYPV
jgi:oxaloacetate decarboxylase alpha subunit